MLRTSLQHLQTVLTGHKDDVSSYPQDVPVRNELVHSVVCVVQISEGRAVGLSQQEVPLQRFLCLQDAELLCAQKSQEKTSVWNMTR